MDRFRHVWRAQDGWSLIDSMLGIVLALVVAGSALVLLQTSLRSQKETGSRLAAQDDATSMMLRVTKDIRAATAATVQDSDQTLDLAVPRRNPTGGAMTTAHVRYRCSGPGAGATCTRYECTAPYVAATCAAWSRAVVLVAGVANSDDFFRGLSLGQAMASPAHTPSTWAGTGVAAADNVGFISVHVELKRSDDAGPWRVGSPLDFHDGADLANFTN
jgi:type II secretory pathway pseudopilin PulG